MNQLIYYREIDFEKDVVFVYLNVVQLLSLYF